MWKCVVVGLALVLPGFLLDVEGRYSEGDQVARQGLLEIIRDLYRQDQLLSAERHSPNSGVQDGVPEKKFDTSGPVADYPDTSNNNNNNNKAQAVDRGPVPSASHADPPGPAPPGDAPRPSSSQPRLLQKLPEGRAPEVNLQASPLALELSQEQAQHQADSTGGTFGVSTGSLGFIMIVAGCAVLAAVGIVGAGVCWYKYNKAAKAASEVEYPAYGVTGPTKDRLPSPGDRKLAQSAQMYHYQHQKQQMIAMEKANGDMKHDASDDESEEDTAEGDYTVYECPGLAPTGEMEVKNPLFRGDETPSTPHGDGDHQGN